jgi:hypothetical protein
VVSGPTDRSTDRSTVGMPTDRSMSLTVLNNSPSFQMSSVGSNLPGKEYLTRRRIVAPNNICSPSRIVRSQTFVVSKNHQSNLQSKEDSNDVCNAESVYSYATDQLSESIFTETLEAHECGFGGSDWDVEAQKYNEETTKLAKAYFFARNSPKILDEIEKQYELLRSNLKKN